MNISIRCYRFFFAWCATVFLVGSSLFAQSTIPAIFPESRQIQVRRPEELRHAKIPYSASPYTVRSEFERGEETISLDDAIRRALASSPIVRVLGGVTAVSSGRTIYDPGIVNTQVDQAHAAFDPTVSSRHDFLRNENPQAVFDPFIPGVANIGGNRSDAYGHSTSIIKPSVTGGVAALQIDANRSRIQPGLFPLNPATNSSVSLSFTQPLLQGAGVRVNMVPIVLARIDVDRSYFQLKSGLQDSVLSVIQAYWNLVLSRIDVWVRQQQIEQADFALRLAEANLRVARDDISPVAQARSAKTSFDASMVAAKSRYLDDEAALRSLLGLPPSAEMELVPTSPPSNESLAFVWDEVVSVAEQQRPDLIELKLVLDADFQSLILARNQARPQLDAVALYRWNGLEGEMPIGSNLKSDAGAFTDWQLGVNFSVPVGLRASRANYRRVELLIQRDQANLDERMHQVVHILAAAVRRVDQLFAQYDAFQKTRAAAEKNLEVQLAEFRSRRTNFITVLQAINDWGNAVNSEAQALIQYNIALATLENETGTILETHGIRLFEERYCSLGPLGICGPERDYAGRMKPSDSESRYPDQREPSEEFFELQEIERRSEVRSSAPPEPAAR
ncbi:MAG: TolC family protein [Pirellulaceae bacterium]